MERECRTTCASPRSRSAPRTGHSPRTPASFYAFPSTLQDILYGPRQRLTKYADGMQALPALPPPSMATPEQEKKEEVETVVAQEMERVAESVAVVGAEGAVEAASDAAGQTEEEGARNARPAAEDATEASVSAEGEETDENTAEREEAAVDDAVAETGRKEEDEEEEAERVPQHEEQQEAEEVSPSHSVAEEAEADEAAKEASTSLQETDGSSGQYPDEGRAASQEGDSAGAAAEAVQQGGLAVTPLPEPITQAGSEEADDTAARQREDQLQQAETAPTDPEHHDEEEGEEEGRAEEQEPAEPPQLRAMAECVPFDPALVESWMAEFRGDTAHTPPGVQRFVANFDQIAARFELKIAGSASAAASPLTAGIAVGPGGKKGKKGAFAGSAAGSPKGGFPLDASGRESSFGAVVPAHNNNGGGAAVKRSSALEALGELWEGRQEQPISLQQGPLRRRGVFGEVERKEIHHMVVAVLNKVTTNATKFREVKNELLRLPIPEANAEQLTKIVDAFFTKAVREQHFSHSYADLIVALCKVPQGQHIVGDKTQSLEYRLRVALLKRCQSEFVESVRAESNASAAHKSGSSSSTPAAQGDASSPHGAAGAEEGGGSGGETEKERRDRMCGNVRFVCELFLREVVVASVISFIFRVCLLGSEFGEFILPPTYTPTESQVDETITAIKTVKEKYFTQSVEGRRMLPLLLGQLEYWVKHYPVSRCRFILMSIVDDLRAMLPAPELSAPLTAVVSVNADGAVPPTPDTSYAAGRSSSVTVGAGLPREVSEVVVVPTSPAATVISVTDGSQSPLTSTMVGGQPLPAPRSRQAGNTSVSESAGSFAGNAHAEAAAAASGGGGGSVVVSPAPMSVNSPLLALALTLSSRQLLQPVRHEAIAKLMAALGSGQSTPSETAAQLFEQYGNVLPALSAWMDRSLSVAKEEKARKQTGALLVACAEQLTAHLPPDSPEWSETFAMCRDQIHEVAIEALQRALEAKLFEDLRIFQFWAQLVLSDHDRVMYDEELLNEGLELIAYTTPLALRNYIVEVSKYMSAVLLKPESLPWYPAAEEHNFVRFRPLLVLHSLVLGGGAEAAQEVLDGVLAFADVRQHCLEMRLYHAFRTGAPTREVIFEQLRSAPRLTSRDPTLAAEVLSAMLIAELCSDGVALVENNMDLIQITVDGVNRAEREMAVVAEVYEVLRYAPKALPRTAAARVLQKFVFMQILSDQTMERADRFYPAESEGVIEAAEKEERVLEPPPMLAGGAPRSGAASPPEVPRITDRRAAEEVLSGSASLRSVGPNTAGAGQQHTTTSSGDGAVADLRPPQQAHGHAAHASGMGGGGGAGTGLVAEGTFSSNASSLAEFHPHFSASSSSQLQRPMGYADPDDLGGQPSLARLHSPTRSHDDVLRANRSSAASTDDASKRLLRNSYKNRRRSHEAGSELLSSAGGSKDVSPQQLPVTHTPLSSVKENSLENSRTGSTSATRYHRAPYNSVHGGSRGGGRGGAGSGSGEHRSSGAGQHNNNNNNGSNTAARGGGHHGESRGGAASRGAAPPSHRGARGGGHSSGGSGGVGRGGSHRDDARRGHDRFGPRGGGGRGHSNRE